MSEPLEALASAAAHDASALNRLDRELTAAFADNPPPEVPNFRTDHTHISDIALRARDLLQVHLNLRETDGYQRVLAPRVRDWLCADADFLLAFYNPSDPATRTVAGCVLASAGMCVSDHPDADAWRFAGLYRLSTVLHLLESRDKIAAPAAETDFRLPLDLARETGFPVPEPYLSKASDLLGCDPSGLDTCAYSLPDDALSGLLSIGGNPDDLLTHFRERNTPRYVRPWGRHTVYLDDIITEAERSCRNHIISRQHLTGEHDFGERVAWRLDVFNDGEWLWFLNGMRWWEDLVEAYRMTGDEKYIDRILQQLLSWTNSAPAPPGERIGWRMDYCGWRTIETGVRMGKVWPFTFQGLLPSARFRPEHLARMLRSIYEQTRYLLTFHQTGNWMTSELAGLGVTGIIYPEFRESPLWRRVAFRRLQSNLASYVYEDGFQWEQSCDYHWRSVWELQPLVEQALENGVPIPPGAADTLARMCEAEMYIATPERKLPPLNDSGVLNKDPKPHLEFGARLSGRQDLVYVATSGQEGQPPSFTSHHFTHAGYTIMRSGWDRDATYLVFDGGPVSSGHCHEDKLSFHLHAFGRPLVIDPGTYQYVANDATRYFKGTPGHNTVTVDGRVQRRTHLPLSDPERIAWGPAEGDVYLGGDLQFASATYASGYWDREGNGDASVRHTRRLLWVVPDYFVISDLIEGDGVHTVEAHYHLAPVRQPDGAYRPGEIEIVPSANRVSIRNPNVANLILASASPSSLEIQTFCGSEDPFLGWCVYEKIWPCHQIIHRIEDRLPVALHTVVYPVPQQKQPDVSVRLLENSPTVLEVRANGRRDLITIAPCGNTDISLGDLTFQRDRQKTPGADYDLAVARFDENDDLVKTCARGGKLADNPNTV